MPCDTNSKIIFIFICIGDCGVSREANETDKFAASFPQVDISRKKKIFLLPDEHKTHD
jgi:hypothetical protein